MEQNNPAGQQNLNKKWLKEFFQIPLDWLSFLLVATVSIIHAIKTSYYLTNTEEGKAEIERQAKERLDR